MATNMLMINVGANTKDAEGKVQHLENDFIKLMELVKSLSSDATMSKKIDDLSKKYKQLVNSVQNANSDIEKAIALTSVKDIINEINTLNTEIRELGYNVEQIKVESIKFDGKNLFNVKDIDKAISGLTKSIESKLGSGLLTITSTKIGSGIATNLKKEVKNNIDETIENLSKEFTESKFQKYINQLVQYKSIDVATQGKDTLKQSKINNELIDGLLANQELVRTIKIRYNIENDDDNKQLRALIKNEYLKAGTTDIVQSHQQNFFNQIVNKLNQNNNLPTFDGEMTNETVANMVAQFGAATKSSVELESELKALVKEYNALENKTLDEKNFMDMSAIVLQIRNVKTELENLQGIQFDFSKIGIKNVDEFKDTYKSIVDEIDKFSDTYQGKDPKVQYNSTKQFFGIYDELYDIPEDAFKEKDITKLQEYLSILNEIIITTQRFVNVNPNFAKSVEDDMTAVFSQRTGIIEQLQSLGVEITSITDNANTAATAIQKIYAVKANGTDTVSGNSAESQAEVDALKEKAAAYDEIKTKYEELQTTYAKLKESDQNEKIKAEIQQLEQELDNYKAKLQEATEAKNKLEQSVPRNAEGTIVGQEDYNKLIVGYQSVQEELRKAKEMIDAIKASGGDGQALEMLSFLEKKVEVLNGQLSETKTIIDILNQQKDKLTATVQQRTVVDENNNPIGQVDYNALITQLKEIKEQSAETATELEKLKATSVTLGEGEQVVKTSELTDTKQLIEDIKALQERMTKAEAVLAEIPKGMDGLKLLRDRIDKLSGNFDADGDLTKMGVTAEELAEKLSKFDTEFETKINKKVEGLISKGISEEVLAKLKAVQVNVTPTIQTGNAETEKKQEDSLVKIVELANQYNEIEANHIKGNKDDVNLYEQKIERLNTMKSILSQIKSLSDAAMANENADLDKLKNVILNENQNRYSLKNLDSIETLSSILNAKLNSNQGKIDQINKANTVDVEQLAKQVEDLQKVYINYLKKTHDTDTLKKDFQSITAFNDQINSLSSRYGEKLKTSNPEIVQKITDLQTQINKAFNLIYDINEESSTTDDDVKNTYSKIKESAGIKTATKSKKKQEQIESTADDSRAIEAEKAAVKQHEEATKQDTAAVKENTNAKKEAAQVNAEAQKTAPVQDNTVALKSQMRQYGKYLDDVKQSVSELQKTINEIVTKEPVKIPALSPTSEAITSLKKQIEEGLKGQTINIDNINTTGSKGKVVSATTNSETKADENVGKVKAGISDTSANNIKSKIQQTLDNEPYIDIKNIDVSGAEKVRTDIENKLQKLKATVTNINTEDNTIPNLKTEIQDGLNRTPKIKIESFDATNAIADLRNSVTKALRKINITFNNEQLNIAASTGSGKTITTTMPKGLSESYLNRQFDELVKKVVSYQEKNSNVLTNQGIAKGLERIIQTANNKSVRSQDTLNDLTAKFNRIQAHATRLKLNGNSEQFAIGKATLDKGYETSLKRVNKYIRENTALMESQDEVAKNIVERLTQVQSQLQIKPEKRTTLAWKQIEAEFAQIQNDAIETGLTKQIDKESAALNKLEGDFIRLAVQIVDFKKENNRLEGTTYFKDLDELLLKIADSAHISQGEFESIKADFLAIKSSISVLDIGGNKIDANVTNNNLIDTLGSYIEKTKQKLINKYGFDESFQNIILEQLNNVASKANALPKDNNIVNNEQLNQISRYISDIDLMIEEINKYYDLIKKVNRINSPSDFNDGIFDENVTQILRSVNSKDFSIETIGQINRDIEKEINDHIERVKEAKKREQEALTEPIKTAKLNTEYSNLASSIKTFIDENTRIGQNSTEYQRLTQIMQTLFDSVNNGADKSTSELVNFEAEFARIKLLLHNSNLLGEAVSGDVNYKTLADSTRKLIRKVQNAVFTDKNGFDWAINKNILNMVSDQAKNVEMLGKQNTPITDQQKQQIVEQNRTLNEYINTYKQYYENIAVLQSMIANGTSSEELQKLFDNGTKLIATNADGVLQGTLEDIKKFNSNYENELNRYKENAKEIQQVQQREQRQIETRNKAPSESQLASYNNLLAKVDAAMNEVEKAISDKNEAFMNKLNELVNKWQPKADTSTAEGIKIWTINSQELLREWQDLRSEMEAASEFSIRTATDLTAAQKIVADKSKYKDYADAQSRIVQKYDGNIDGVTSQKHVEAIQLQYKEILKLINQIGTNENEFTAENVEKLEGMKTKITEMIKLFKSAESSKPLGFDATEAEKALTDIKNKMTLVRNNSLDGSIDILNQQIADIKNVDIKNMSFEELSALQEKIKNVTQALAQLKNQQQNYSKDSSLDTSISKINAKFNDLINKLNQQKTLNSRFMRDPAMVAQYNSLMNSLQNMPRNAENFHQLDEQFKAFKNTVTSRGLTGRSLGDELAYIAQKIGVKALLGNQIYRVISYFRKIVSTVSELDKQMTILKRVTDEASDSYSKFFKNAKKEATEVGAAVSDVVSATAEFSKLGYNLEEATSLGKSAVTYANVGFMDAATAIESLSSVIQAFKINANESMDVVDKMDLIGNKFAIDSQGLGSALQRSASSLVAAGNSLDESISLVTTGNVILQDPESVANGIKIIGMRIRGRICASTRGKFVCCVAQ